MPSDEYSSVISGRGLRFKGAKKVKKHKKEKKDKDKGTYFEKALSAGGESSGTRGEDLQAKKVSEQEKRKSDAEAQDEEQAVPSQDDAAADPPVTYKTEAERRHQERKKAKLEKLLELSASAALPPEFGKTHRQRVDELNTKLSKLSEHHDMPKIGPG